MEGRPGVIQPLYVSMSDVARDPRLRELYYRLQAESHCQVCGGEGVIEERVGLDAYLERTCPACGGDGMSTVEARRPAEPDGDAGAAAELVELGS